MSPSDSSKGKQNRVHLPVVFTMGNFFNYNGKIYQEDTAVIGPDNRGLRYGDGLFETIKLNNGYLIFSEEHFDRLWRGLNILQFDIPKHFTSDHLQKEILALAKKNELVNARIRLNVFRGDGGLNDAKDHLPNYIIQAWPLLADTFKLNSNGLILGIDDRIRKSIDILSNLKHNNYLPNAIAALNAKKEKWNDAIILNAFNRVCETTIANIYLIKNGVIYTPALSEGCVAGVMRNFLVEKIKKAGYNIEETAITIETLLAADEVFLSNSIYNIRWVQSIPDKKFDNIITQKIFSGIISTIL